MANIGSYPLNEIITGDSRLLAQSIPDESIDLIFTDPIYSNHEDYIWLARLALRILKPSGALICWSNGKWQYINTKWLESEGLNYRRHFGNVMVGGMQPMEGKVICKTNQIIWLDKGASKMFDYLPDGLITTHDPRAAKFKWGKSIKMVSSALRTFSKVGQLVYDPFTGYGSIPFSCVSTGRDFIASEINPETAINASRQLRKAAYAPQLERSLTLPAPDGGDSAPSQALSTPDMFSAIEHEPTPAPRR